MPKYLAILAVLSALLLPGVCNAAQSGKTVATDITAERMQYDAAGQKVVFSGNVHVTRPDFELWSSSLTAHLHKRESGSSGESGLQNMNAGQIERIVAEGSVRMKAGIRTGTCGKATYTLADGKLVMERDPEIIDTSNNNRIAGDSIIFHTRDGRSDVVGRVRASFSTADKNAPQFDAAVPSPAGGAADRTAPEPGAAPSGASGQGTGR